MMSAMASLVDALGGRRLFAEFPAARHLTDWVPAAEVLVQEGLRAWALPAEDPDRLAEALRLYGRRAVVGVYGVRTPDEVAAALAAGARFVTAPVASEELVAAAGDAPFAPGALTPNEVHYALGIGAGAVNVVPAEVLGMAYARALGALFPGAELVASGRLERFQCDMWLDAGASVVGLQAGVLFPEPASAGGAPLVDLGVLRRRAQEYGPLV